MDASLAACVMMVGGWIAPECEIATVPLRDDFLSLTAIQHMYEQEQANRALLRMLSRDEPKPSIERPPVAIIEPGSPPLPSQFHLRPKVIPEIPTQAGELPGQRARPDTPLLPRADLAVGDGSKPFSGQGPTPSPGVSPWMLLYARTNNGTISPYFAYVLPALQQQQFNQRVREQINTMQSTPNRGSGSATPGSDVPMGSGMANPQIFNNYHGYYPPNQ